MPTYDQTPIFQSTLAAQIGETSWHNRARERLRNAFERFRARASTVAEEIKISFPSLTDHGVSHLDALWEMASYVTGPDYPMTPTEGLVLGGAFLIHDLGNGLAAFPGGASEVRQTLQWRDGVARRLRATLGRVPSESEISEPTEEIDSGALGEALRLLHATQAQRLPHRTWVGPSGQPMWLIEDSDVRNYFGDLIGLIAASHRWPVGDLEQRLLPVVLSAPPWLPDTWTVDSIKVACVFRVADAIHLDQRRAPDFLAALRRPEGLSQAHWLFQSRLGRPRVVGTQVVFTGGRALEAAASDAWWTCFEMLRQVDREIKAVNELLSEARHPAGAQRPGLAVTGVAGIESPEHLAKYVTTDGWLPVDCRVHVSDVRALVEKFGGRALYGDDPDVPLRELLQNAADAVRARRILERHPSDWGEIVVETGVDHYGAWIEVADTGVGMSKTVLLRQLLDFGQPFWSSGAVLEEFPGLMASDFRAVGHFGIGFFSVFMWGDRIRVMTRRYDAGHDRCFALEFGHGLSHRPVLRSGGQPDDISHTGTRVRVWLSSKRSQQLPRSLREISKWIGRIAPALDVDVLLRDGGILKRVIRANDWLRIRSDQLICRVAGVKHTRSKGAQRGQAVRLVRNSEGVPVARIALDSAHSWLSGSRGVIAVWGLVSASLYDVAGIIVGSAITVDRKTAAPHLNLRDLTRWATEQATLQSGSLAPADQMKCAAQVCALGGVVGNLKVARMDTNFLTLDQIGELVRDLDEFVVVDSDLKEEHACEFPQTVLVTVFRCLHPWQRGDFFSMGRWTGQSLDSGLPESIGKVAASSWGKSWKDVASWSELDVTVIGGDLDVRYSWIRRAPEADD